MTQCSGQGLGLFIAQLRYQPAGKIMTPRNLLITAEFAQLHPGIVDILRFSMENGWKLFETCMQAHSRLKLKSFTISAFELSLTQENEEEWRRKRARSKTKTNFIALMPTAKLKSKELKGVKLFDSRGFLRWKVMARVKAWCRAASWVSLGPLMNGMKFITRQVERMGRQTEKNKHVSDQQWLLLSCYSSWLWDVELSVCQAFPFRQAECSVSGSVSCQKLLKT